MESEDKPYFAVTVYESGKVMFIIPKVEDEAKQAEAAAIILIAQLAAACPGVEALLEAARAGTIPPLDAANRILGEYVITPARRQIFDILVRPLRTIETTQVPYEPDPGPTILKKLGSFFKN